MVGLKIKTRTDMKVKMKVKKMMCDEIVHNNSNMQHKTWRDQSSTLLC